MALKRNCVATEMQRRLFEGLRSQKVAPLAKTQRLRAARLAA